MKKVSEVLKEVEEYLLWIEEKDFDKGEGIQKVLTSVANGVANAQVLEEKAWKYDDLCK